MPYRWELLLWLWLAFFFHQADRQVFNVILPLLGKELSLSSVQLGLVGSVFVATNALLVPVSGFLGDVWPRKRIVTGSLFAWSLATLCTGFGGGLFSLVAVRGVATAAGEAFYFPSAVAMLTAEHSTTRARALSLFQTSVYIGIVASGWIGGTIAARWGWRAVFWIFGGVGLALSIPLRRRLRNKRSENALERVAIGPTLRTILATPTARCAALAAGAMVFVNVGYLAWMPSYLYERFHMTLAQAGLSSMLIHHVFAFIGVLIGGALSDRLAPVRPQARLEMQAWALLAGAPFLYLLGRASTEGVVYGALAGFGFFRGLYDSNTYPAFYAVIPAQIRSAASGLLIAFAFLVGSAAPVLLGKAKDTIGLAQGLSSLSLVYVFGAMAAFWGAWKYFMTDMKAVLAILLLTTSLSARVKTGLDILVEQDFAPIAGKRVGVITNHTALTWDHRHIVPVLAATKKLKLTAIFSPEHGFAGTAPDATRVASTKDPATGIPVYSLFDNGANRPNPATLKNVDVLLFDIQDIGARFYTYPTTLAYVLEAAAPLKIPVYVLDRPNPINGLAVEGPLLEPKYFSFLGYFGLPIRHGMTTGELARLYNAENKIGADLHVIQMQGWERGMWMDQTGLEWTSPSPAIRNLTEAILYPGSCLLENEAVSIGRGTNTPFQIVGAPWFKGMEMADYLNARHIPGVRFLPRRFTPDDEPHKGQPCDGLDIQLVNRDAFDSSQLGLELLAATLKFHPGKFTLDAKIMSLLGSDKAAEQLRRGQSGREVSESLRGDLAAFRKIRAKYLLY